MVKQAFLAKILHCMTRTRNTDRDLRRRAGNLPLSHRPVCTACCRPRRPFRRGVQDFLWSLLNPKDGASSVPRVCALVLP